MITDEILIKKGSQWVSLIKANAGLMIRIKKDKENHKFIQYVYQWNFRDKYLSGQGLFDYLKDNETKWEIIQTQNHLQIKIRTRNPFKQEDYIIHGQFIINKKLSQEATKINIKTIKQLMQRYELQTKQQQKTNNNETQISQLSDSSQLKLQDSYETLALNKKLKEKSSIDFSQLQITQKLKPLEPKRMQLQSNPYSSLQEGKTYKVENNQLQTIIPSNSLFFQKTIGRCSFLIKIIKHPNKNQKKLIQIGVSKQLSNKKFTIGTNKLLCNEELDKRTDLKFTFSEGDIVKVQIYQKEIIWFKYLATNCSNRWDEIGRANVNISQNDYWRPFVYMSEKGTKIGVNPPLK